MTVEEFISEYQDLKRAMKQKEEELEFANKLMEKLREENKQLKGELGSSLDKELEAQLEKKRKLGAGVAELASKGTDTNDLAALTGKQTEESPDTDYEGENPEQLKEKLSDLSRKLQDARSQIKVRAAYLGSHHRERQATERGGQQSRAASKRQP